MKLVIALGGNALGKTAEEQLKLVKKTAESLVDLIEIGHKIVISHGNGPQVGMINNAFDYAYNNNVVPGEMPFAECGAMSQGYIGYHLQQAIKNELIRRNINKECVSLVTQVLVDKEDKAFLNPTKPVGMFYDKVAAERISNEKGYTFIEDSGRGYRRVVPSPKPLKIIEMDIINKLLDNDFVVIASGGGGIPVIEENGTLKGISAVIDKDFSSEKLAEDINADMLLILTAVDKVCINYNTENEQSLDYLSLNDIASYINEEQFAKGSMLPKIEACKKFVESTHNTAIITSLLSVKSALEGKSGTIIKKS